MHSLELQIVALEKLFQGDRGLPLAYQLDLLLNDLPLQTGRSWRVRSFVQQIPAIFCLRLARVREWLDSTKLLSVLFQPVSFGQCLRFGIEPSSNLLAGDRDACRNAQPSHQALGIPMLGIKVCFVTICFVVCDIGDR